MSAEKLELANGVKAPSVPISIALPEDPAQVKNLAAKADEYWERVHYKPAGTPDYNAIVCRLTVLRWVLDAGSVHSKEIIEDFSQRPDFDEYETEEALRIVDDYCRTGGQNLSGGTGLDPEQTLFRQS